MDEGDWLAARFEENRPHLRAVAYRVLGRRARRIFRQGISSQAYSLNVTVVPHTVGSRSGAT